MKNGNVSNIDGTRKIRALAGAVQVVSGGIEQGNNVDKAIEILKEELIQKEAIVEALRIRDSLNFNHSTQIRKDTLYSYERILPKMTYRDGAFYDIGYREINDTLVDKRQLSKLKEFINATN